MNQLSGLTAVVTGAGRGIGRAIALALGSEGCNLVLISRTISQLEETASLINNKNLRIECIKGDISKESDVNLIHKKVIDKFGDIDILVNNAGVGYFKKNVIEMDVKEYDEMFDINMRGLFLITKTFLPAMIRKNNGDIVNISSLAGRNAIEGGAVYAATKWAVIGFSRSLMLEVRKHNIRVITVCPGSVNTTFSDSGQNRISIPQPEDIARVVIDALLMPRNVMVSEIDVRPTNPIK
ncbi:MAG: 3-oxoacyl-[acyl-carrier protein] reductase [Ignavibacteriae bacterium]|nr:MAG: 3-oxoacyl-[acyl-carrier protein] reductase [Ignavibacteriota bacterium]